MLLRCAILFHIYPPYHYIPTLHTEYCSHIVFKACYYCGSCQCLHEAHIQLSIDFSKPPLVRKVASMYVHVSNSDAARIYLVETLDLTPRQLGGIQA